ncbi:hypothetical protein AC1031_006542 [Aphanomyces cochlioides]|nr:hypothetical protein AC1031_006542 [Aphanomyces cochlioides]
MSAENQVETTVARLALNDADYRQSQDGISNEEITAIELQATSVEDESMTPKQVDNAVVAIAVADVSTIQGEEFKASVENGPIAEPKENSIKSTFAVSISGTSKPKPSSSQLSKKLPTPIAAPATTHTRATTASSLLRPTRSSLAKMKTSTAPQAKKPVVSKAPPASKSGQGQDLLRVQTGKTRLETAQSSRSNATVDATTASHSKNRIVVAEVADIAKMSPRQVPMCSPAKADIHETCHNASALTIHNPKPDNQQETKTTKRTAQTKTSHLEATDECLSSNLVVAMSSREVTDKQQRVLPSGLVTGRDHNVQDPRVTMLPSSPRQPLQEKKRPIEPTRPQLQKSSAFTMKTPPEKRVQAEGGPFCDDNATGRFENPHQLKRSVALEYEIATDKQSEDIPCTLATQNYTNDQELHDGTNTGIIAQASPTKRIQDEVQMLPSALRGPSTQSSIQFTPPPLKRSVAFVKTALPDNRGQDQAQIKVQSNMKCMERLHQLKRSENFVAVDPRDGNIQDESQLQVQTNKTKIIPTGGSTLADDSAKSALAFSSPGSAFMPDAGLTKPTRPQLKRSNARVEPVPRSSPCEPSNPKKTPIEPTRPQLRRSASFTMKAPPERRVQEVGLPCECKATECLKKPHQLKRSVALMVESEIPVVSADEQHEETLCGFASRSYTKDREPQDGFNTGRIVEDSPTTRVQDEEMARKQNDSLDPPKLFFFWEHFQVKKPRPTDKLGSILDLSALHEPSKQDSIQSTPPQTKRSVAFVKTASPDNRGQDQAQINVQSNMKCMARPHQLKRSENFVAVDPQDGNIQDEVLLFVLSSFVTCHDRVNCKYKRENCV